MCWLILLLILFGCDNHQITNPSDKEYLELWMDLPSNGDYYEFDFPMETETSYCRVMGKADFMDRIFWYSNSTYTFYYWGQEYTQPIITNSSYTSSEGVVQALAYVYQGHIGDTLDIIGCNDGICKEVKFIVK